MVVYLFMKQVNAKDEAKRQKYRKWIVEEWQPYATKLQKEGVSKGVGMTDNSGTMYGFFEFEDMDALAKLWNDEEFHRLSVRRNELVEKIQYKLCRPSMVIPPK